jgi:predicted PurR-regulated permease PerM
MNDPNVLNSDHAPSRSTVLDLALQIGLVGFLVYACSRYISPFSDLLIWSAILAVMLYPLHLRLAVRRCISGWPSGSAIAGRRC